MSLLDELDGAQLVVIDKDRQLAFAWFGGQGVNVYDEDGRELDYFTVGSSTGKLTPALVRAAIDRMRMTLDE
jgi:hypothetical protein